MSTTIAVACPECHKQLKIRPELEGKKVRCKDCDAVFTVKLPAIKKAAPPKKPAPAPPKPSRRVEDEGEYDNPNPYGVTSLDLAHRCPHCAAEFESEDAVICLECGYNTQTREHIKPVKTIENTGVEQFLWLLPGIACVLAVLALIGLDIFWCFFLPEMVADGDFEFLASTPITLWLVVASLFAMYFAGRYAFQRLVLNPVRPQVEKH
jgi:hypothetical protein